jgi:predicted DNA-binding transcriptional regulator YafY
MSTTPWADSGRGNPGRAECGATGGRNHLARLFQLVHLLQTERFPNARELSERCEVSRRTVYRDIELLEAAGVPVRYRQDREGYQLARGFFLPPTGVDETEALALLVLARQWNAGDGLGLLRHAWGGAVKVAQTLNAEVRERVFAAVEPFEPRATADDAEGRPEIHDAVLGALSQLKQVRIWYQDAETFVDHCTKFSIYRLLLHERRWYMVGRSTVHRRVEVVGVPWVRKAVLTDDPYEIPPRFRLDRYLANAWGVARGRFRYRVALRFSAKAAPELNDAVWHRSQKSLALEDGRVELHFSVDGLDEITRWVRGCGDQVEVVSPPELRQELFLVSTSIARRNRPARRDRRARAGR